VDQELLLRNEYLAAENRFLKAKLKGRVRFSDAERARLEIGHRLGRKVLGEVATVARPDTILAWYRKVVARKFDGSKARRIRGRPRVDRALEQLIVGMAKENLDWGYDRIVEALANRGYEISDQTVGNILQRHGLPPAPERQHSTTGWADSNSGVSAAPDVIALPARPFQDRHTPPRPFRECWIPVPLPPVRTVPKISVTASTSINGWGTRRSLLTCAAMCRLIPVSRP
jgi:hypothetical protein